MERGKGSEPFLERALTPFCFDCQYSAFGLKLIGHYSFGMPRRARSFLANVPVHIVQRGNNRQACFRQRKDFRAYLAALGETSSTYNNAVYSYVLMANHIHMLVNAASPTSVSRMMQQLGRKYVSYFNKEHGRTGTLWEGRFRSSSVLSERYLFACYRSIEQNPIRARMTLSAQEYDWSSYRVNALGHSSNIVTPSPEWLALGNTTRARARQYRKLFADQNESVDNEVRVSLRKGRALR